MPEVNEGYTYKRFPSPVGLGEWIEQLRAAIAVTMDTRRILVEADAEFRRKLRERGDNLRDLASDIHGIADATDAASRRFRADLCATQVSHLVTFLRTR